ncbi:MAG: hypothetical protein AB8U25_03895 [Rickettsiales endosymbiont of Dermacentor nuttalli]
MKHTSFGIQGSGIEQFDKPKGRLALDNDDKLYIADALNNRIQIFNSNNN